MQLLLYLSFSSACVAAAEVPAYITGRPPVMDGAS